MNSFHLKLTQLDLKLKIENANQKGIQLVNQIKKTLSIDEDSNGTLYLNGKPLDEERLIQKFLTSDDQCIVLNFSLPIEILIRDELQIIDVFKDSAILTDLIKKKRNIYFECEFKFYLGTEELLPKKSLFSQQVRRGSKIDYKILTTIQVSFNNLIKKLTVDEDQKIKELKKQIKQEYQLENQILLHHQEQLLQDEDDFLQHNIRFEQIILVELWVHQKLLIQCQDTKEQKEIIMLRADTILDLLKSIRLQFNINEGDEIELFYQGQQLQIYSSSMENYSLPEQALIIFQIQQYKIILIDQINPTQMETVAIDPFLQIGNLDNYFNGQSMKYFYQWFALQKNLTFRQRQIPSGGEIYYQTIQNRQITIHLVNSETFQSEEVQFGNSKRIIETVSSIISQSKESSSSEEPLLISYLGQLISDEYATFGELGIQDQSQIFYGQKVVSLSEIKQQPKLEMPTTVNEKTLVKAASTLKSKGGKIVKEDSLTDYQGNKAEMVDIPLLYGLSLSDRKYLKQVSKYAILKFSEKELQTKTDGHMKLETEEEEEKEFMDLLKSAKSTEKHEPITVYFIQKGELKKSTLERSASVNCAADQLEIINSKFYYQDKQIDGEKSLADLNIKDGGIIEYKLLQLQ